MASIIRAKKGAWFLGVCKGLEKSNRGNALFWRLVFFYCIMLYSWLPDFDISWISSYIPH